MTQCKYCHKDLHIYDERDEIILFCSKECLNDYVIVQILQAKQDMARMGLK